MLTPLAFGVLDVSPKSLGHIVHHLVPVFSHCIVLRDQSRDGQLLLTMAHPPAFIQNSKHQMSLKSSAKCSPQSTRFLST